MSLDRPAEVATTWAEPRTWTIVVDQLGRPLTANAAHSAHWRTAGPKRREWRDAVTVLARAQRIPRLPRIAVTVQGRYKTRASPPDCDAIAPTCKGAIDGLVQAGVLVDDGPPFVASVTYMEPQMGTGLPDALVLTIDEVTT